MTSGDAETTNAGDTGTLEPAALTGKVVTVLGPIDPGELGVCLPHEHVICALDQGLDWPDEAEGDAARFAVAPITLANLERVHRQPLANRANLRLDDPDEMAAELRLFAAAGGARGGRPDARRARPRPRRPRPGRKGDGAARGGRLRSLRRRPAGARGRAPDHRRPGGRAHRRTCSPTRGAAACPAG